MKINVIQIRDQPPFAHGEKADRVSEAIVVSGQFFPACAEDRIAPVAEKLRQDPKDEDPEQDPLPRVPKQVIQAQSDAVQAEHGKFSAFEPHAFDKQKSAEAPSRDAAQKPEPKQSLRQSVPHHLAARSLSENGFVKAIISYFSGKNNTNLFFYGRKRKAAPPDMTAPDRAGLSDLIVRARLYNEKDTAAKAAASFWWTIRASLRFCFQQKRKVAPPDMAAPDRAGLSDLIVRVPSLQ